MHMTYNNFANNEKSNQYLFWSYCFAIVSAFVIADVFCGGFLRESLTSNQFGLGLAFLTMFATVGVYASDGAPGARFIRSYSRHKL
jgi:hypothetical protein